ncbi:MAG: M6 family metalloprotease domain-containing protein [Candidatus Scalindua sp.]|nr:M6 family metalloprotease domain-containing protein [Candidatus Scalindua sp.]
MKRRLRVPPAPEVMAMLYAEYLRTEKCQNLSFRQYLEVVGYSDPSRDVEGMDDGDVFHRSAEGPELIRIPNQPITGIIRVKVLLVDFEDKEGFVRPQNYEDLLFSKNTYPTGSMRDYYHEVSLGNVDITGTVHGWIRMPRPYSFYTNKESGQNWYSYPRNAQGMAEDAVRAAIEHGVVFEPELDKLNQGMVTALFIIHAGRGAEELHPSVRGTEIWSHKWVMQRPVKVSPDMDATIYLMVPHDCKLGVCAHELGHLAFQWQDFYDPNYDKDGKEWSGSGKWDLMAGGSYNGGSVSPAHPAGLHKAQHRWIDTELVTTSKTVTLNPYTATSGKVLKIVSPRYKQNQYLILENRIRTNFDTYLPGEGLLVWRVDESGEMLAPDLPGLLLIQADGKHELEQNWDQGDGGDPFPGMTGRSQLGDTGDISTSFPEQERSGVSLSNIRRDPVTGNVSLDVKFELDGVTPPTIVSGEVSPFIQIPDDNPTGVSSAISLTNQVRQRI